MSRLHTVITSWIDASLSSFPPPPPAEEKRLSREMLNKLRFWKTKTQAARDVDLGGTQLSPLIPLPLLVTRFEASHREMALPYARNLPVDVDLGMPLSPLLPLCLTPFEASHQEMVQSGTRTQPAEHVDPERQRVRAENLRRNTRRFRVLIIGRANAGKTTILQRVCNTTEQPRIFNPKGLEVCATQTLCH